MKAIRVRTTGLALASAAIVVIAAMSAMAASPALAAPPLQVRKLSYTGLLDRGERAEKDQITVPLVTRTPDSPVAHTVVARINDSLFIHQFTALAPRKSSGTLTAADRLDLIGVSSLGYSITRNDGRIFTVVFEGEGCGAYCEEYATAYSFDVRDGALLTAANLFTPAGMQALAARMSRERQARYRKQIADIEAAQKRAGAKGKPAAGDDDGDRLALNESCLESAKTAKSPAEQRGDFLRYVHVLSARNFEFTAGRCSNHASRGLDDVDRVTLKIAYADLAPHLTGYGRAVLLEGTRAAAQAPPDALDRQVLRGVMTTGGNSSSMPITLLVKREDDDSLGGHYFYDKVRKPISLTGTDRNGQLQLDELSADTATPGSFPSKTRGRWAQR